MWWPLTLTYLQGHSTLFWLGIQHDSIVWVIMRQRGYPQNAGVLVVLVLVSPMVMLLVMGWLFNFPGKLLKLFPSNFIWLIYGLGKVIWWPWVKVMPPKRSRIDLVTWGNFGESFLDFFFAEKHTIGHIGTVGSIDMKQKGNTSNENKSKKKK